MAIIPGTTGNDHLIGLVPADEITGLAGNDTIEGGAGDDTLFGNGGHDAIFGEEGNDRLNGGGGDDFLSGGAGYNIIRPGEGEDMIEIGLGDDHILLDGRTPGEGFLMIQAHSGAQGMFALIDGDANFGGFSVYNDQFEPAGGALITDLNNALQLDYSKAEGGMAIYGTEYADEFLIDAGEKGWIMITPGEGEDIIHIEGESGTVRLDYADQDGGIFANLRFGLVIDGSEGFTRDRIVGGGHVRELRATDYDDDIFGSNHDERFILRAGNDSLNGRGGNDTVRYDRNDVTDGVEVDLGQKIAIGVWGDDNFSHSLKNIESVRGSKTGDDIIKGNAAENTLDGKGGKDLLAGRGGNDALFGGDGNDTLDGGSGDDYMLGGDGNDKFVFEDNDGSDTIGDFDNGADKINLRAIFSDISDFSDLQANHLSEVTDDNGTHSVINYGIDDAIVLLSVINADLSGTDFLFGPAGE